jgi:hypothetical protein
VLLVQLKSAEVYCGKRHFEQALRVVRPPPALSFATPSSLPATQGQRSKDRAAALRLAQGTLAFS